MLLQYSLPVMILILYMYIHSYRPEPTNAINAVDALYFHTNKGNFLKNAYQSLLGFSVASSVVFFCSCVGVSDSV